MRAETRPEYAPMLVAILAAAKFALQIATSGRYGIFRDEPYYIACSRHLAAGYVDQPPLIACITWFAVHVFGTSLFGLRVLPALAGAALVWVAAAIARELGGGGWAQGLAAFSVIPVPIYLLLDHWLTMNAFEPLIWMGIVWLMLRMIHRDEPRYWIGVGVLCGLGLENKYSVLFLIAAMLLGLLLTRERRVLWTPWLAAGVLIALLIFLPNLLWLVRNHFPFLEFERHSRMSGSRLVLDPVAFLTDQVRMMNAALALLWVCGVAWLFASKAAQRYRFLGWTFAGVFLLLLTLQAKDYYVAPVYPIALAAGAVACEQWFARERRWIVYAYAAVVALIAVVLLPSTLPVLPVPQFIAYERVMGRFAPIRFEKLPPSELPQQWADEFGWEEMARKTGEVYASLPPEERKSTAIFANNYGEAGAIDFFGPKYGLPPAISNHESYWLWGPRGYTGSTVIVLGSDGRGDREHFRSVEAVAKMDDPRTRPIERFDIYLCRGLVTNLRTMWPEMKRW